MILGRHFLYHSLIEVPEKVTLTENLNSQAKRLVAVTGLYIFASSLSAIFLTIYLFKVDNDITKPLIFYLGAYIGIIAGFILGGELLKKIKLGALLGIGLLIAAIFYLSVVFLGSKSVDYVLWLGLFCGISEGFFWLVRHIIEYSAATDSNRNRFFAALYIVNTVALVAGPVLSGFLIISGNAQNFPGYLFVFALTSILMLVAALVALRFNISHQFKYRFRETFHLAKNNYSWKGVELADFFHGMRMGAAVVLIGLVAYMILENELDVGGVTTLGAALSLAVGYWIGKFSKKSQRFKLALIGSMIAVLAYVILIFWFNITGLFIYVILMGISAPVLFIIFGTINNKAIDLDKNFNLDRLVAYKISNEIWWNLGRIISIGIFLLLLKFANSEEATKMFLLGSVVVFPLMVFIYKHYKLFDVKS